MRKQYSLWQKLARRGKSHLTPEEMLNSRDHMRITQVVLTISAILLVSVIVFVIFFQL